MTKAPSQQPLAVINIRNTRSLFRGIDISSSNLFFDPGWGDPTDTTDYEAWLRLLGEATSSHEAPPQLGETAEQLIRSALISSANPESNKVARQLLQIHADLQEEDAESCLGISVPSLTAFLTFLKEHEDLRPPIISATPECNIYASWKADHNHVFSIHFLREDKVRFVIFRPNDKHTEHTVRISGTATADVVFDIAASHGVRQWACK